MAILNVAGMQAVTPYGFGSYLIPYPFSEGTKIPDFSVSALGWKGLARKTREARYSCLVAGEAMQKAGWLDEGRLRRDKDGVAVIVATNESHLQPIAALHEDATQYGAHSTNPALFPDTVLNVVAGHLSVYFGIEGENITLCGSSCHIQALQAAADLLEQGMKRVLVCMLSFMPPRLFEENIDEVPAREFAVAFALDDGTGGSDSSTSHIGIHFDTIRHSDPVPSGPCASARELPMWMAVICEQLHRNQYNFSRMRIEDETFEEHVVYLVKANR